MTETALTARCAAGGPRGGSAGAARCAAAEEAGLRVSAPPQADRAASEWAGGTSVRLWGGACVRPPPQPRYNDWPGGRPRAGGGARRGRGEVAGARGGAAGQRGSGGGGRGRPAAGARAGRRDGGHPRFPVFRLH